MGRGYFWHKDHIVALSKPVQPLSGHVWIIYVAGQILWTLWLFLIGQLGSECWDVQWTQKCLRSCFKSCLYAKNTHSRPCTTGYNHCLWASLWHVPKSSKALQGIWTTNLWGKMDDDGLKNLCVVHMDQANLALLPCLHSVITWLVSQEKSQEKWLPAWQVSSLLWWYRFWKG